MSRQILSYSWRFQERLLDTNGPSRCKDCDDIDLNNTVNKFDLLTYIPELNKRKKKIHSFQAHVDMKKQSVNQVSKFQIINIICGGFSCGSAGKESACDEGDVGSIPGLGISPREGKGYPCQYSGLGNSIDCIDHEVAKS